jgi:hypothetical protein
MKIADIEKQDGKVKVRKPFWHKEAYLELTYQGGMRGPWSHLYDEPGNKATGMDNPQALPFYDDNEDDWELIE